MFVCFFVMDQYGANQEVTVLVCVHMCVCEVLIWCQIRGHSTGVCVCICDCDGSMWCKSKGHSNGVCVCVSVFLCDG